MIRRPPGSALFPDTTLFRSGAAASLDAALLNAGTGTVSFAVADGGVFFVFASDFSPTQFSSGASFTLTANFADGSSDRESTPLNSRPDHIAYAGFCLTKNSLTVSVTGPNFQAG